MLVSILQCIFSKPLPVMREGEGEGSGSAPVAVSSTVIGGGGSDFDRLCGGGLAITATPEAEESSEVWQGL